MCVCVGLLPGRERGGRGRGDSRAATRFLSRWEVPMGCLLGSPRARRSCKWAGSRAEGRELLAGSRVRFRAFSSPHSAVRRGLLLPEIAVSRAPKGTPEPDMSVGIHLGRHLRLVVLCAHTGCRFLLFLSFMKAKSPIRGLSELEVEHFLIVWGTNTNRCPIWVPLRGRWEIKTNPGVSKINSKRRSISRRWHKKGKTRENATRKSQLPPRRQATCRQAGRYELRGALSSRVTWGGCVGVDSFI